MINLLTMETPEGELDFITTENYSRISLTLKEMGLLPLNIFSLKGTEKDNRGNPKYSRKAYPLLVPPRVRFNFMQWGGGSDCLFEKATVDTNYAQDAMWLDDFLMLEVGTRGLSNQKAGYLLSYAVGVENDDDELNDATGFGLLIQEGICPVDNPSVLVIKSKWG